MLGESLALVGFGFLLGLGHAFDADHIAAVSTLVSKHRSLKKATVLGAFWGLGHTTTLFIVGLLVLGLKITIPEKIALSLELVVGVMIVILGISAIKSTFNNPAHIHKHTHNGIQHIHFHSHKESKKHNHAHKSFAIGLVHGLAGSAALMLLILSTVKSSILGAIYILVFGVGSMTGMALASTLISLPFIITAKKFSSWNSAIKYITGIFSILFGVFLVVKIIFLEGL